MKTTFISTASFLNSPRSNWGQIRADITKANTEITTGRLADAGLTLGARTGQGLDIRRDSSNLQSLIDDDGVLAAHLDQSQAALATMSQDANDFLKSLVVFPEGSNASATVQQQAQAGLASFIDAANSAAGGHYLFGGINSGTQPLQDHDTGPKAAVDAAFQAAFGVTQSDPAAANITAGQMSDFLDNQFAALFADPAWGTNWSNASNQNMTRRISPSETVDTSVNANEPAMRKLAMAYTMVADLGLTNLNTETRNVILTKARDVVGGGVTDVTNLQGGLGETQKRVSDATDRMKLNQDLLSKRLGALEGVDPAEAKVRSDTLSSQLEMSYSLTTKLLKLSILNYA